MKKLFYIISILLAGILITVWSCTKEETKIARKQKTNDPGALKAFNRIKSFKNQIAIYKQNPQYKSGELISIDSLLWDFNATLNFDYSEVDDAYKNFYSESVFPELTFDENNMVSLDDAVTVYLQLETDIQNTLTSAPYIDKAVQFTYLKIEHLENQTLTLKSKTTVGEKGDKQTTPFSTGDDWMYGDNLGDCYGNYYWERDGADEIRDMAESRRHLFINDEGVAVFYVNPVTVILEKDDIDNNPLLDLTNGQGYDNERDFRIFYAHEDNCPTGTSLEDFKCIEYDDMNFYLGEIEDLIYNIIPNEPVYWPEAEDYTFVRFDSIVGTIEQDNNNYNYLIHKPEIVFAERKTIER